MQAYTIQSENEETECAQCGAALWQGDRCYLTSTGEPACSESCAQQLLRDWYAELREQRRALLAASPIQGRMVA
jgi:endogenous inhibitor of DNA gyrase (YacG/DUF329 family)